MSEELQLDRLLKALARKIDLVVIAAVVCALLAGMVSVVFLTPRYESSVLFYISSGADASGVTVGQLSAAQNLVESGIVLLKTPETMIAAAKYSGVQMDTDDLLEMVQAEMVQETEFLRVTVTDTDPVRAQRFAAAIGTVLPKRMVGLIPGVSMTVAQAPVRAECAVWPRHSRAMILGGLVGLTLSGCTVLLLAIFDRTLWCEADVHGACRCPVLAVIPDMETEWSERRRPKAAILRSYEELRTKLNVLLPQSGGVLGLADVCRNSGEWDGAVRLAKVFSRLGQRVLLIHCDLRKSRPEDKCQGLAGYLSGRSDSPPEIRTYRGGREEDSFDMIFAGHAFSDPAALLTSPKVKQLLARYREEYDKILLTFPSLCDAGDAVAAVSLTDGMLLDVYQGLTDRNDLTQAVQQLEFANANILGVAFHSEPPFEFRTNKKAPQVGYLQEVGRRMKSRDGRGYASER